MQTFFKCFGGVVSRALACRWEEPLFHFAFGQWFFFSFLIDRHRGQPSLKKWVPGSLGKQRQLGQMKHPYLKCCLWSRNSKAPTLHTPTACKCYETYILSFLLYVYWLEGSKPRSISVLCQLNMLLKKNLYTIKTVRLVHQTKLRTLVGISLSVDSQLSSSVRWFFLCLMFPRYRQLSLYFSFTIKYLHCYIFS